MNKHTSEAVVKVKAIHPAPKPLKRSPNSPAKKSEAGVLKVSEPKSKNVLEWVEKLYQELLDEDGQNILTDVLKSYIDKTAQ